MLQADFISSGSSVVAQSHLTLFNFHWPGPADLRDLEGSSWTISIQHLCNEVNSLLQVDVTAHHHLQQVNAGALKPDSELFSLHSLESLRFGYLVYLGSYTQEYFQYLCGDESVHGCDLKKKKKSVLLDFVAQKHSLHHSWSPVERERGNKAVRYFNHFQHFSLGRVTHFYYFITPSGYYGAHYWRQALTSKNRQRVSCENSF